MTRLRLLPLVLLLLAGGCLVRHQNYGVGRVHRESVPRRLHAEWFERNIVDERGRLVAVELLYCPDVPPNPVVCRSAVVWRREHSKLKESVESGSAMRLPTSRSMAPPAATEPPATAVAPPPVTAPTAVAVAPPPSKPLVPHVPDASGTAFIKTQVAGLQQVEVGRYIRAQRADGPDVVGTIREVSSVAIVIDPGDGATVLIRATELRQIQAARKP